MQLEGVESYVVVMVLHIQDLRLLQIRAYLTKARLLGTPPHYFSTRRLTDLPILVRSKYDAGEATTRRDYFELHFETARLRSVCANEFSVLCANEFCAHCALYLFRHLQNLHGLSFTHATSAFCVFVCKQLTKNLFLHYTLRAASFAAKCQAIPLPKSHCAHRHPNY